MDPGAASGRLRKAVAAQGKLLNRACRKSKNQHRSSKHFMCLQGIYRLCRRVARVCDSGMLDRPSPGASRFLAESIHSAMHFAQPLLSLLGQTFFMRLALIGVTAAAVVQHECRLVLDSIGSSGVLHADLCASSPACASSGSKAASGSAVASSAASSAIPAANLAVAAPSPPARIGSKRSRPYARHSPAGIGSDDNVLPIQAAAGASAAGSTAGLPSGGGSDARAGLKPQLPSSSSSGATRRAEPDSGGLAGAEVAARGQIGSAGSPSSNKAPKKEKKAKKSKKSKLKPVAKGTKGKTSSLDPLDFWG